MVLRYNKAVIEISLYRENHFVKTSGFHQASIIATGETIEKGERSRSPAGRGGRGGMGGREAMPVRGGRGGRGGREEGE